MDFVIGLIIGLFFGGWIGLAVASLMANSREQEIMERLNGDPDGSKAVMEEAIETLKEGRKNIMSTCEEYQHWLGEHKEDEAVEKFFDERRSDDKATDFLKGVKHD